MNLKDSKFYQPAALMLDILPDVMNHECFALKGGTAINFFYLDMPRLSVDIELTYLPLDDRKTALNGIKTTLLAIEKKLKGRGLKVRRTDMKLFVSNQSTEVKVEPNTILRGTVEPPGVKRLCQKARRLFEVDMRVRSVAPPDLYGGKICAALDRQHPRDFFDVMHLLHNKGLTKGVFIGFLVYLISHDQPITEVLNPRFQNFESIFKTHFEGMSEKPVTVAELERTRARLVKEVTRNLTSKHKEFLISVKEGSPRWELLPVSHAKDLPAVKWKLLNIGKMTKESHKKALNRLKKVLS